MVLKRSIGAMSLVLVVLLVVLSGCGNSESPASESPAASTPASSEAVAGEGSASGADAANANDTQAEARTVYPLTIQNYTSTDGAVWTAKAQTFAKPPERVVANTQPVAELLIKLGLADSMVGVAALYGEADPEVAAEFAKIPVLSEGYVGKELVVGASPDLVMGRGGLFADADWGVGTVDALNDLGITTFIHHTSVPSATLDSLYQDIEQIGQIFDVQANAQQLTAKLKERAEAVQATFADKQELTFAYVFDNGDGSISAYSGHTDTFQSDALGLLKLRNAFGDVEGEISPEQLVGTSPDVLLISHYTGGIDPKLTIESINGNAALESISAVKNKRIFVIDFNEYWGYGDQIFNGVEKLAVELAATAGN